MAFLKRTWLARLGTGLNKFLIGDKGADGKQTLTNSPDTVVQEGDVISADNLNDLEDRIDDAFDAVKWRKIWTNPDPDSDFSSLDVTLDAQYSDILIFYRPVKSVKVEEVKHFRISTWGTSSAEGSEVISRVSGWNIATGTVTSRSVYFLIFNGNPIISLSHSYRIAFQFNPISVTDAGPDNTVIIPVEIYVAGDIYNS